MLNFLTIALTFLLLINSCCIASFAQNAASNHELSTTIQADVTHQIKVDEKTNQSSAKDSQTGLLKTTIAASSDDSKSPSSAIKKPHKWSRRKKALVVCVCACLLATAIAVPIAVAIATHHPANHARQAYIVYNLVRTHQSQFTPQPVPTGPVSAPIPVPAPTPTPSPLVPN